MSANFEGGFSLVLAGGSVARGAFAAYLPGQRHAYPVATRPEGRVHLPATCRRPG
jgi:hypothetical protein